MTVFTIGHSTRPQDAFLAVLVEAAVELLADVRAWPRSRRNPQFNGDVLAAALRSLGIDYVHLGALGGRRGPQPGAEPSANAAWREAAFRNYADYALTPPFRTGLAQLLEAARRRRLCIMCAEVLWWRCHRRTVADHLLAAGIEVVHLLGPGRREAARLTPGAQVRGDGSVVYPAAQSALFDPT